MMNDDDMGQAVSWRQQAPLTAQAIGFPIDGYNWGYNMAIFKHSYI